MGFFDFLDQDAPPKTPPPKRKPLAPDSWSPSKDAYQPTSRGDIPPETGIRSYPTTESPRAEKPHVTARAEASSAVISHAHAELDKLAKSFWVDPMELEAAKSEVRGSPEQAAFIVERLDKKYSPGFQPRGGRMEPVAPSFTPDIKGLEQKIKAFKAVLASPEETAWQATLLLQDEPVRKAKLAEADAGIADRQKRLEDLSKIKPVSDRERAERDAEMKRLQGEATALLAERKTHERPEWPAAPVDLGGFGKGARVGGAPLGIDPMRALKNATGSDEATAEFLGKVFGMSKQYGDFDLAEQDDFGTGMRKFVEGTGPEGAAAFYGAMLKTFGGGIGGLAAAGFTSAGEKTTPEEANERARTQTQEAMRQRLAELRETDPMKTTGGVLLFVVMSMLLGPGIATLILTDRHKQGKLVDDIEMLKTKMRGLDDEKRAMERREAQRLQFRQQASVENRRFQNQLTRDQMRAAERHRELIAKREELKARGERNPIFEKMMAMYNGAIRKSQALSGAMDYDAAKAALADADWYFRKANEAVGAELEGE